jgi:hypothetical protein
MLVGRNLTRRGELRQLKLAVLSSVRRCSVGVVRLVLARDVRGETLGRVEGRGGSRPSRHQRRIAQIAIIAQIPAETDFCDLCEYCDGIQSPVRDVFDAKYEFLAVVFLFCIGVFFGLPRLVSRKPGTLLSLTERAASRDGDPPDVTFAEFRRLVSTGAPVLPAATACRDRGRLGP